MAVIVKKEPRTVYDETQYVKCESCPSEAPYEPGSYSLTPDGWIMAKAATDARRPQPHTEGLLTFCTWGCVAVYAQHECVNSLEAVAA